MVGNREEWLASTIEDALEPGLRICDPHHHIWDYPTSRYLVEELVVDLSGGHRVEKTVFVECRQFYRDDGPENLMPVGETEYVDRHAGPVSTEFGQTEVAAGIVGFADLSLGSAVMPVLEAHMEASSRFRGVRHATAWHESDRIHNAHTHPPPGLLAEPVFRDGLACLEKLGLSFDAWLYHPQLPELTEMARARPGLSIVLDHMAGPLGIGPYAGHREDVFESWLGSMSELAECPNVHVKLGGLTMTMSGFGWHKREKPPGSKELADVMSPYYLGCIEQFGPARCMFESNFPVDRASCSYTNLWNAFKRLSGVFSEAERSALFHDTAVRVYRLDG